MAFLRCEAVCFGYGLRGTTPPLIEGLDLTLERGCMTAILGPNGAGKSTVLRLIAGLLEPWSGRCTVEGKNLHRLPPRQRARLLALVSAEAPRDPWCRVCDWLAYGRAPHGDLSGRLSANERRLLDATAEELALTGLLTRPLGELSSGELQRALAGQALLQQTPVLLLDEPTAHLDLGRLYDLLSLVRRRVREHNIAVLAVLHDPLLAAAFFDRALLLRQGRMIADAPPSEALGGAVLESLFGAPVELTGDTTGASLRLRRPHFRNP